MLRGSNKALRDADGDIEMEAEITADGHQSRAPVTSRAGRVRRPPSTRIQRAALPLPSDLKKSKRIFS